jgi:hypothetical protein
VLDLSGPEAVSFPQAARILTEASGTPVRFEDETDADHEAWLRAAGTPEGYVRWRMAMLGGIRRGEDAYLSDGVKQVLGRSATGLRDWAAREVRSSAWALAARADQEGSASRH